MHNDFNIGDIVSFTEEAKDVYRYTTKESGCIGKIIKKNKTLSIEILDICDEYKNAIGEEVNGINPRYVVFKQSYKSYKEEKINKKKNNFNLNNLLLNGF